MNNLSVRQIYTILIVFSVLLFIPFLGRVHLFDWDEINFAECAREMLVTRNYTTVQINFQPFWEKPPLFIWMQALSMKMFGVNEFAARFPNAICGIFTLITVFKIGESVYDKRFGFLWGLSFGGSILPFLYFKSGIIDPWFNLFIFSGIYRLVLITNNVTSSLTVRNGIFAGVFFGLATLTKGPVAILIALLSVMAFIILQRKLWIFSLASIAAIASSYIIVAGSWFLFLFIIGKQQLINDFLAYQLRLFSTEDSGHGGFFGYHFVVLLIGCFPASLFSFIAWRRFSSDTPFQRFFKNWMVLLFWVVLILFSIVKTKIVHYSSLCYFPLSFLSAYGINKLLTGESKWNSRLKFLGIVISLFLGLAFSLIPLIDNLKEIFISSSMIKDSFTIACLSENVGWKWYDASPGIIFLFSSSFFILGYKRIKFNQVIVFFVLNALCLYFILLFIVPKIERYSQGPEIDFFKNLKDKKCYTETVGFKSFAPLFYAEKTPELNTPELIEHVKNKIESDKRTGQPIFSFNLYATNFIRGEEIRFPAYFSVRFNDSENFEKENPHIKKLYTKGGYCFYMREPNQKKR